LIFRTREGPQRPAKRVFTSRRNLGGIAEGEARLQKMG
jgi:hypothetical protein